MKSLPEIFTSGCSAGYQMIIIKTYFLNVLNIE